MCPLSLDTNGPMKPADNNLVRHEEGQSASKVQDNDPTERIMEQQDVPRPQLKTTPSLASSDSTVSTCSDVSVDANYARDFKDNDESGHCQDNSSYRSNGHLRQLDSALPKRVDSPGDNVEDDSKDISALETQIDAIWTPPEAQNVEDEQEHSVYVLEDDDDEYDGWSKSSSLEEEVFKSHHCEQEKRKAFEDVKNGKFKSLVSQLLNTVGLADANDRGVSWVDLVASLAWEAASFVKPDHTVGKAMDPACYVKIKCIPTGLRSDSQLIKGLVFKKHAAHKHMPTNINNPRLLLVRGMFGHTNGLASFNSMIHPGSTDRVDALTDAMKSLLYNLEACRPNVILVEKSVPRNVLEEIRKRGMTLVSDMKLHRLERVARCTGSPILSSDNFLTGKLKHCDKIYFEKLVEEHAVVEGGKKPSKTLMFLEGCPTQRGCSILLKGSRSDELKRIKCVVQCAVAMAYHFILETSFLLDQKKMFSTIPSVEMSDIFSIKQHSSVIGSADSLSSLSEETTLEAGASSGSDTVVQGSAPAEECASESAITKGIIKPPSSYSPREEALLNTVSEGGRDITVCNGFREQGTFAKHEPVTEPTTSHAMGSPSPNGYHEEDSEEVNIEIEDNSMLPNGADAQKFLKAIGPSLPYSSPTVYESVSTCFGLNDRDASGQTAGGGQAFPNSRSSKPGDFEAKSNLLHAYSETLDDGKTTNDIEEGIHSKDDISSVLDAESILVLMSSRNASRGTICEQSHFSHIKFYRHFDEPLGKFLKDYLLNQSRDCKACGELPEAHIFYFAHHSKQLTARVKKISKYSLPGASEGKLWMWSRCGKCSPSRTNEESSKRVLISAAARGLSFGKFLELCFSNDSLFNSLSSCGHSLHKDFLYFFGLGPMVAMFKNTPVVKYTVSLPPQKLEFNNPIKGERIEKETEIVLTMGISLFSEIAGCLKKNETQISSRILNLSGCPKEITHIQKMLDDERDQFHANIRNICDDGCHSAQKLLYLNRLRCDLLLEACVWNQRLRLLLSSDDSKRSSATHSDDLLQGRVGADDCEPRKSTKEIETQLSESCNHRTENGAQHHLHHYHASVSGIEATKASAAVESTQNLEGEELRSIEIEATETADNGQSSTDIAVQIETMSGQCNSEMTLGLPQIMDRECNKGTQAVDDKGSVNLPNAADDVQTSMLGHLTPDPPTGKVSTEAPSLHSDVPLQAENRQTNGLPSPDQSVTERTIRIVEGAGNNTDETESEMVESPLAPSFQNPEGSVWNSFPEVRRKHLQEIYKGQFPNFAYSSKVDRSIPPVILAPVSDVIMEEGSRHHIPIRDGDYLVSDFEGEISSTVACALAMLKDVLPREGKGVDTAPQKLMDVEYEKGESAVNLSRAASEPGTRWSSRGFSESDASHLAAAMSLDMRFSSFDGLNLLDSLSSFGSRHPEVSLGGDKNPGKSKWSVVCLYAAEFRGLRDRCCPDELDFIASLSRCRIWNAKGGKSKSFFAKTLDDRLIIKEIKKTEFDSFMQFAPAYFDYMKQAVDLRNQTCLAKILGIYQVTVRQPTSGKELKQDLMVMENLSFGRHITRQYDLKGALHARFTAGDGSGDVLLDQNFVNDMNASPMYVGQKAKRILQRAVWNDTPFLGNINVMDYSLLVGVDEQRKELVCGIIDYLRQYTWDKQLENWVKSSLVVPKNVLPTIISPNDYRKRFKKFVDIHFLSVPDHWCSQRSSKPCKLCGIRGDHTPLYANQEKREDPRGF